MLGNINLCFCSDSELDQVNSSDIYDYYSVHMMFFRLLYNPNNQKPKHTDLYEHLQTFFCIINVYEMSLTHWDKADQVSYAICVIF